MTEYTLVSPITTHAGQVTKITLKRPKARAYITYGEPFTFERKFDADGTTTGLISHQNTKAFQGFMAEMTGLDPIDLEDLDAFDFRSICGLIQALIVNPPTPAT